MVSFIILPDKDKKTIFEQASARTGLPAYAIEKDWWVVQILRIVFSLEIASNLTFKGGTSLSKAWKLIERFSEDIDLVLDRSMLGIDEVDTKKKVKTLRHKSKQFITDKFMPLLEEALINAGFAGLELEILSTNPEDNDPLAIQLKYPKVIEYNGYLKPDILLEIGCRSQREPYSLKQISSFVNECFPDRDFADKPIEINTVNPERTFLEKIFLLHELFQSQLNEIRVERMSRHLYDIERMMDSGFATRAFQDRILYQDIVNHRKLMFSYSYVDYSRHQPKFINPIPPDEIQKEWRKDYETMQASMIYGNKPTWDILINRITDLKERINNLDWEIEIN